VTAIEKFRFPLLLIALLTIGAATAAAQSPNTATMIVTVVDQSGAVVKDAKVSVVNTATGAAREAVSGDDGSATFAALSLTGEYKVTVTMAGFETPRDVTGLTLRAGETASVNVKLVAGGGASEVPSLALLKACARIRRSAGGSTARESTRRRFSAAR